MSQPIVLTIRNAQKAVLAEAAFEAWMERHIREVFPDHYRGLGAARTRALIREGIRKARGYGFQKRSDLCQLIALMVAFGRDFDTSLSLPWAAEILADPQPMTPEERMQRLHRAALRHLEWLAGLRSRHRITDERP